jgi:hypothetical protein
MAAISIGQRNPVEILLYRRIRGSLRAPLHPFAMAIRRPSGDDRAFGTRVSRPLPMAPKAHQLRGLLQSGFVMNDLG